MNRTRQVWIQECAASLPHFRALGTLPRKYGAVPVLEDAGVVVATVDYLLTLPTGVTAEREVVAVEAFSADPDAIVELKGRSRSLRIGEPTVIALSAALPHLHEPLGRSIPTFVEALVQVDREMDPAARLAEMIGIVAALGMPPSSTWRTSTAYASTAMAAECGSITMTAAHRTSAAERPFIEISVTEVAERRTAHLPTDGSADPAEISVQSITGQWVARPLYASPLRHFWNAAAADYVADVLGAVTQARRAI